MPAIDLSILNQRQTPAFYADTLANRPAAGFVGRIFVSTDTFAFYRDNGTTWDLIGGPGTGTITGSGANGQVSYWNGASTITGSNDLFFDAVNGHLGIGTITPGTALDVKHDQSTVVQLEQITATNDIRIAFINSGVGLWRLGAFYNAGANDFGLFDIAAAAQPVTVKRTTGQVLIGTSTVGSGKLVVASATGDNGIQIVGATAPSLRIDNAENGPTKRAGLGISTATNNFIQGSADRDFCMFNGSTTASPILFGIYDTTNVQEAARISAARNFLIGTTTDAGYKLNVNGTGYINNLLVIDGTSTNQYINFYNGGADRAHIYWHQGTNSLNLGTYIAGGSLKIETGNNVTALTINSSQAAEFVGSVSGLSLGVGNNISGFGDIMLISSNSVSLYPRINRTSTSFEGGWKYSTGGVDNWYIGLRSTDGVNSYHFYSYNTGTSVAQFTNSGNLLIGTTTDAGQKLQVNGDSRMIGNVGIKTNPDTFLDIGSYGSSGNYINEPSLPNLIGQYLINLVPPSSFQYYGGGIGWSEGTNTAAGINVFDDGGNGALGLSFATGNNTTLTQRFTIDSAGIGTFNGSLNIGNSVSAAIAAPSTHKVSILINGVQYYLLASNV
jgi:hypothetical protein